MARNSKDKNGDVVHGKIPDSRRKKVGGFGNFKGFIQHSLVAEERQAYDSWVTTYADFWDDCERIADSGYKLSCSWDNYNNTMQASLTCNNEKLPDFGWVLVARAPDVFNALNLLLFKHLVLLGGDWSEFHERSMGVDRSWG